MVVRSSRPSPEQSPLSMSVWVMNLAPQQLQSTTDTQHGRTTLDNPADFGSESALAQVT